MNNKFPKSDNNLQCIDKCYNKKKNIIHPFTLNYEKFLINSCPISLLYGNNILQTNITERDKQNFSKCSSSNEKKNYKEINYFAPEINISDSFFLKYIYNFSNIDETISFLYNNELPIKTKNRILNSIWKKYGKKELPDILINYYIENFSQNKSFEEISKLIKNFINKNIKNWNNINNIHKKILNTIK